MKRTIIALIETPGTAEKLRDALAGLDVEVITCSPSGLRQKLLTGNSCDLVIFERTETTQLAMPQVEADVLAVGDTAYFVIVADELLPTLRMPAQLRCDFAVRSAQSHEIAVRIQLLLWPGTEVATADIVTSGALSINLATYQVTVGDTPIDFTYLEYALLSFLVTHPGRVFSREVLLQRIWGYEYFGGTRTVDVHVRRVRAKLGLELAQHLETVRSVGYMWNL